MPCEHYKDALIEAAAAGAAPQGDLGAHLATCASCREAFAHEQSLFAAIDSGLHAAANTEVPPSLLPRVRTSLDEAAAPRFRWVQPAIFASAGVVLALLVLLLARPPHRTPEDLAKRASVVAPTPVEPATNTNPGKSSKGAQTVFAARRHSHAARNSTNLHSVASSTPEVLVPPNEREAFARLIAALNKPNSIAAALLTHAPEKEAGLVSLEPLQIPGLEIKPLEGTEAETSDGAGEKR